MQCQAADRRMSSAYGSGWSTRPTWHWGKNVKDAIERLVQAAFSGNVDEVTRLLDEGMDIDATGRNWNALHAAIENEHFSCVQLLLARGANVNLPVASCTPLEHAVDISIDGNNQTGGLPGDEPVEIVQLLISNGANIAPGLVLAKRYRSQKLIRLLEDSERGTQR